MAAAAFADGPFGMHNWLPGVRKGFSRATCVESLSTSRGQQRCVALRLVWVGTGKPKP